jgi:hypothetical protein
MYPQTSLHRVFASIATLRQLSLDAFALLTDLTEACPLIPTHMNVKTHDGGQQISGLVDCAATLDFVSEDLVRRFSLHTENANVKTPLRLANRQRMTPSTVFEITFELARHEFKYAFYILRDLCVANLVLGLPWLDTWMTSKLLYNSARRVFSS